VLNILLLLAVAVVVETTVLVVEQVDTVTQHQEKLLGEAEAPNLH
jgi:hypothetical protein